MKSVTIRCGVEIESGRSLVVIEAGDRPSPGPTDPETNRPKLDLCAPRTGDLPRWLLERSETPERR